MQSILARSQAPLLGSLFRAANALDAPQVLRLTKESAGLTFACDEFGRNVLHMACASCVSKDIRSKTVIFKESEWLQKLTTFCRLLLNRADEATRYRFLHDQDHDGRTLLSWLAAMGLLEPLQLALDMGARPVVDEFGFTPIHYAILFGRVQVLNLLLSYWKSEPLPAGAVVDVDYVEGNMDNMNLNLNLNRPSVNLKLNQSKGNRGSLGAVSPVRHRSVSKSSLSVNAGVQGSPRKLRNGEYQSPSKSLDLFGDQADDHHQVSRVDRATSDILRQGAAGQGVKKTRRPRSISSVKGHDSLDSQPKFPGVGRKNSNPESKSKSDAVEARSLNSSMSMLSDTEKGSNISFFLSFTLHLAVLLAQPHLIVVLSRERPRLLDERDDHGRTPLHMACLMQREMCVDKLLSCMSEKQRRMQDEEMGWNALSWALVAFVHDKPRLEIWIREKQLLSALLDERDRDGITPRERMHILYG